MILLAVWLAVQTPPPDSVTRVRWERMLHTTNDSLDRLGSAIATFRADLKTASPPLVIQRASQVHQACTAANRVLTDLHALLGSPYSAKIAQQQAAFRSNTSRMLVVLDHCQRDWSPEPGSAARADTLKAWGPYRTANLEHQVLEYVSDMRRFSKAAGLAGPGS
ncbi:MAG TPA: hypothetical protein VMH88_08195 [Gemmatimonadales bacterium]|nr:hypothetical protein [Gemmatimonadales bacterium]